MVSLRRSQGRGYYRWVMVFVLAFMTVIFYGSYYSFSVFLKPVSEEFNWTRAATSGAISIYMFLHGFLGIAAGALLDRYGAKTVLLIATIIVGLGYLLMSQISALWQLYLYFGILIGIGMSATWIVPGAAVAKLFPERKGLPVGIVYAALNLGQLSLPPLASVLIADRGWRFAYAILAASVLVLALPAALLLRNAPRKGEIVVPQGKAVDNKETAAQPKHDAIADKKTVAAATPNYSLREAMGTLPFWLLFVDWFLMAIPLQAVALHAVAYATDRQIDAIAAAGIMTVLGIGGVVGRLIFGAMSDRIGGKATLLICIALQLIGVLPLVSATTLWMFYLSALVFGLGYGGAGPNYLILGAEYYGLKSLGTIVGVLSLGWSLGAAFGAPWAGFIHDITGSYSYAFLSTAIITAVALALLLPLRPPAKSKRISPQYQ